jgi:fatty acid-binding protein DegV
VSAVAICTDSTALLSASAAASLGVEIVPIAVTLDGERFDELTSSLDWFYERMRAGATASVAELTAADFSAAFGHAAARGAESIVSVHVDARLGGTVAAVEAATAAAELPTIVVDTRTVSFGVGLCVRAASAALAAGGAAGDAARAASRLGAAVQNGFVVRTDPTTRPPVDSWTVFRYLHGAPTRIAVWPSLAEAVGELVRLAVAEAPPAAVAIGHAGREIEPATDELARQLRNEHGVDEIERYRIGPSVGAELGADTFALFWQRPA